MYAFMDNARPTTDGPTTFAEPGEGSGYGSTVARLAPLLNVPVGLGQTVGRAGASIMANPAVALNVFNTAERDARLTSNIVSEMGAREEVYDRRIAALKAATGIELENPHRGGYRIEARKRIRDEVRQNGFAPIDESGGIPAYQKRIFDERLAEALASNPDRAVELAFGDLDTEARALARGATQDAAKAQAAAAGLDPLARIGASFGGALWGQRRDPIFVGSLFAGPTSAVGKTALTRIATSALAQGAFNAGLSALEQPVVQQWRADIGVKAGIVPAIEEVGFAFLFGVIPGAAIQGIRDAARGAPGRNRAGDPRPGDVAEVMDAIGAAMPQREAAAIRAGEEAIHADRALLTEIPQSLTKTMARRVEANWEGNDRSYVGMHVSVGNNTQAISWGRGLEPKLLAKENGVEFWLDSYGTSIYAATGSSKTSDRIEINPIVGTVKTAMRDGERVLDHAVVSPDFRRRGIGTRMLGLLEQENPSIQMDGTTGMVSPDGASLVNSYNRARLIPQVDEALHNDLSAAALRHAENADAPSPAVLLAERAENPEIARRVAEANPQTLAEARQVASEAMEEAGEKAVAARTREEIDAPVYEPVALPAAPQKALKGGYRDSRGQGAQFHGAPNEVNLAEGNYGSSVALYGTHSLYTSDALDVVHGYANKKTAKAASIYEVIPLKDGVPSREIQIYDMERPISAELHAEMKKMMDDPHGSSAELIDSALSEKPKNLREFFDEVRGYASGERIPADEVQEGVFHPLMDFLEGLGFHGMRHVGGLRTNTPTHNVTVYFSPEKNVRLRKMSESELSGLREPPPPPATAPTLPEPPKLARNDPLDKVPLVRDDGTVNLASRQAVARQGERETLFADLVRSCK